MTTKNEVPIGVVKQELYWTVLRLSEEDETPLSDIEPRVKTLQESLGWAFEQEMIIVGDEKTGYKYGRGRIATWCQSYEAACRVTEENHFALITASMGQVQMNLYEPYLTPRFGMAHLIIAAYTMSVAMNEEVRTRVLAVNPEAQEAIMNSVAAYKELRPVLELYEMPVWDDAALEMNDKQ